MYSSANAEKYSLTIKGLITFVPTLVTFLTLVHINVDPNTLTGLVDGLAVFVSQFGMFVGGGLLLLGSFRKALRSWHGENDVTNTLNQ